jgi:hypothetical protein
MNVTRDRSSARASQTQSSVRVTKFMIINSENYMMGNKAMASVLLLYYHLMNEGCFCGDETVFIDPDEFDGFNFLDVKIEDGYETDIDEKLIQQGAVIYLLCDLNDMVTEHEECFLSLDITKKIISCHRDGLMSAIPEVDHLFALLDCKESSFDFESYNDILIAIYRKYVLGTYRELVKNG